MQTNKQPEGDVVVTTTEEGCIVCVTRQDEEGRVLSIIAEGKPPKEKEDTELIKDLLYLVQRFSHCDESGDYYMEIEDARERARKRLGENMITKLDREFLRSEQCVAFLAKCLSDLHEEYPGKENEKIRNALANHYRKCCIEMHELRINLNMDKGIYAN